jgi:type IV pilus assembly protein PilC
MADLVQKIDQWLFFNSSVPLGEKVFFAENLRVMVHAGLSISEGMNTLALQAESKLFRKVLQFVKEHVEQGRLLSQGMAKFPKIFPPVFTNMIQIGELSGTLESVLGELATQMKKDYTLRSKVRSAMTYPIVVLVAMVGITVGLLVFVLPKMLAAYKEMGAGSLPWATQVLIAASDFMQAHGIAVGVGFLVFVVGVILASKTGPGRSLLDLLIIKGPIIGPIARKVNLARFTRTLSGLMRTDIPVVQAFQVTADVLGNVHYSEAARECGERIKKGEVISATLSRYPTLFPPLVVQMISVGERSGTVDALLADVAVFYEEQVDATVDGLSSVIEPLLILFLGGGVGVVAVAVIAPMYSMASVVGN